MVVLQRFLNSPKCCGEQQPLIAQHFLKYSAEAGLHVPIRVEIYENAQGKTCIGYDQPSTLLQQSGVTQEEFVCTATELDQKAAHHPGAVPGNVPSQDSDQDQGNRQDHR